MAVEIQPSVIYYLELKSIFTSWIRIPLRVAFVAAGVFFVAKTGLFCSRKRLFCSRRLSYAKGTIVGISRVTGIHEKIPTNIKYI